MKPHLLACALALLAPGALAGDDVAGVMRVLDDDGGWCWFEGERCVVQNGQLLVGSVSAGTHDPLRRGDINLVVHDLETGASRVVELHDQLERDDHDSPAIVVLPDGRLLTVYARHGNDSKLRVRVSTDAEWVAWEDERVLEVETGGRGLTYSNVYRLPDGVLVDFFRGGDWNPHVVVSSTGGASWGEPVELLRGPGRPYMRYVSDGQGGIHFACSEQHPRNFDSGVRHGVLRDGAVRASDGTELGVLAEGPTSVEALTLVFAGKPDAVAWCNDIRLDAASRPVIAYSVQLDGAGLPPGQGGLLHEYRRAHWDGEQWVDRRVAHAGRRLYAGEDDYTGLIVLDPADPDTVVFSTDADPSTGAPLVSAADGERHHELFRGRTADGGRTWEFEALTRDSTVDNLRPVFAVGFAVGAEDTPLVVWLRGRYATYGDFALSVVAMELADELPALRPIASPEPATAR